MLRLTDEERIEAEEKGLKEGEKKKAIEIARNMLEENIPFNTIIRMTGLSKEDIDKIDIK